MRIGRALETLSATSGRRNLTLVLVVVISLILGVDPAQAHSELTGMDVQRQTGGGGTAPNLVLTLAFSEAIDPGFGRVNVVAQDGTHLEVRSVSVTSDMRHLTAEVLAVPEGAYTVGWFVRSRDGDASNGSTELTVGSGEGATAVLPPVNARDPAWQPPMTWRMTSVSALVRWMNYIGAVLFTGTLLFRLFVWPATFGRGDDRADDAPGEQRPPGFNGLLFAGLGTLFFANVLVLLLQTSFVQLATLQPVDTASPIPVAPSGLQQARASTAVGEILTTFAGTVWIARTVLLAVLAGLSWRLMVRREQSRGLLATALAGALGLLLTLSLTAHAAFVPPTFGEAAVAVLIDWSHLVAVSLWLGGLLPLLLALRGTAAGLDGGRERAAALLQRFSPLALGSVAFLALTGIGSSYFQVGNPALLFKTLYGVTLDVKLGLIGVLVAIGALNRYVLIPRVRRGSPGATFERSLPVEIGFGLLLLFTVAMLASQGAAATAWPAHEALGTAVHQTTSDTDFVLRVVPGSAGDNTIAVDVTDRRRGAWRTAGTAVVTGDAAPADGWDTTRLSFENTPTERYLVAQPIQLPQGTSRFSVRLERPGYEAVTATFDAEVPAAGGE